MIVVHNNNTTNEQSLFLYAKALNKDHRSSKIRTFAARSSRRSAEPTKLKASIIISSMGFRDGGLLVGQIVIVEMQIAREMVIVVNLREVAAAL